MIQFSLNNAKFKEAARALPALADREMRTALEAVGVKFREVVVTTRLSGRPGLESRTGRTVGGLVHQVRADGKAVKVLFHGEPAAWVNIHETGGVIVANGSHSVCGKGKMLAIPLRAAKTASAFLRAGPCGRNLILIRSKTGNLILAERTAQGLVPMFVLKRSVTIPARLGFRAAWRKFAPDALNRIKRGMIAVITAFHGRRP